MASVLFIAGDLSGDLHAARVAEQLKAKNPSVKILALGGPALKSLADEFLFDLVNQSVVGFWEPLKKIPVFRRVLNQIIKPALEKYKPLVVPVDFFGFNKYAAKAAKDAGCPVVYFIGPQVWASRPGRVQILKNIVDRILVIFPFEEEIYGGAGVPVTFVGHPLLDGLPPTDGAAAKVEPVVGLLPGSRRGEVRRHLSLFLESADVLSKKIPGLRFILFAAPNLSNEFYDGLLGPEVRRPYILEIVRDENYQWRRGLDLALTCSGSATLENALLGIPMVVVYKMSWITYALARALVRVKHIAMANILAGREIVPELIQGRATPKILAETAENILRDAKGRAAVRRELSALRQKLGAPGASRRAAEEILKHL